MQVLLTCLCLLVLDQAAAQLSNPLANNKHISVVGNKFLERTAAPARKNWPYDTLSTAFIPLMLTDHCTYVPPWRLSDSPYVSMFLSLYRG